ncbi:hypothetical protein HDU83_002277 [Entophlyctis luteolus]|nr:hypothetical protein HDU83_002277 [Entophlyctis luteolus]
MCFTSAPGSSSSDSSTKRDILPASLVPSHYNLRLIPDLESFTFEGTVAIDVAVVEDTFKVVLNSKNLTIHKASVFTGEKVQHADSITFNTDNETVTFEFAEALAAGSNAVVAVEFTGIHNDLMAGFYKSSYVDGDGNKKYLVVTQFEATDCRQAFPSFDEPSLKATFDCKLVVPVELTALANMNDISTVEFDNAQGKRVKEVTFARTPRMSTYLVAFCVGDFESIETVATPKSPAGSQPIKIRLFTVKGLVEQGRFALDVAARTHEFYSEYFDEAFPLPKSDLVAIPDFSAGAMENWGLVTYRNVALLCDENSTAIAKKRIAYVVGHELAHQWFGNLVTMKWWNDLWLNEGFATFVGWLAVDHLFPEWDVWTGFINSEFSSALSLDGLRSSHPIDVPVKSASDVMQIFDAISYSKGATVIRMLNNFLGGQKFMDGVRTYLQEFKYKNAETADLWKHLSASSGLDIGTLMHGWTAEMGYPLITVESQEFDETNNTLRVTVSQSRFLSAGGLTPEEDHVTWWVPLTTVSHLTGKAGPSSHVLSEKVGTITFNYQETAGAFWKLNFGASGMYRVKYLEPQVTQIAHMLKLNLKTFSVGDKIMFLADAMALTKAGLGDIRVVLSIIDALAEETDFNVLETIARTISNLISTFYRESPTIKAGLKALGRNVFSRKVVELGYEFPGGEDYFVGQVRGLAIETADACDDLEVQAELRRRFDLFVAGDATALHSEIRGTAFASVLRNASAETVSDVFDAVFAVYKDPSTQANLQISALVSLGSVNSAEHVDRLLNVLMFDTEVVRNQDFYVPLSGLARLNSNPEVIRPLLREWFRNKWEVIYPKFETGLGILGHVFNLSFGFSVGDEVVPEIEAWVSGEGLDETAVAKRKKEVGQMGRLVDQTLESVKSKTELVARERDNLAAYFAVEV